MNCLWCKSDFEPRELLALSNLFWPEINVVVTRTPCCDKPEEVRVETGRITLGYSYGAGSAHFCGMIDIEIDGLTVVLTSETIQISFAGQPSRTLGRNGWLDI
jgi:hypothetical protein